MGFAPNKAGLPHTSIYLVKSINYEKFYIYGLLEIMVLLADYGFQFNRSFIQLNAILI